ncbi:MAG: hypothetical protein J6I60_04115 [Bacteroidaceae bacterium]|nr:hypothetical protein [Bacteroidaceae bacterium]
MTHTHLLRPSLLRAAMLCCLAATMTIVSSCDESHYLGSDDERIANGFYIDGFRTHVETAGFYYSEEQQGYNIFFSSDDESLSRGRLNDVGRRRYLSVDLPASALGKRVKLNADINDDDPNHFNFQLVTDHVPNFPRINTSIPYIQDGYVEFDILDEWVDSYHKNIKFELRAEIINGRVIEANYNGPAQICTKYIGWWGQNLNEQ